MIYEYKCSDCSKTFEVWAKLSDPPPAGCPDCQSPKVERIISATAFALKGSGWYTTDYKRNNSSSASSSAKAEESKAAPTALAGGCGSGACGHNHGGGNT